ncbi:MAG: single-stranded DNA-binding protein [Puniceicoccales bacterium]|jgi:single-strand DNA-binding protein|nr:single-stranded DNA-binding protein [Puniceicoccales bacterium]
MASYNKVILAGNLTRDPELRTYPNGTVIAKFGLAVNRRYTTKEGEARDDTLFVDIDSFGKQAEVIGKYCTKGSAILIDGHLKLDQWQDKTTNEKRNRLVVVLDTFTFIGGRGDATAAGGGNTASYDDSAPPPRRPAAPPRASTATNDSIEEDVPF